MTQENMIQMINCAICPNMWSFLLPGNNCNKNVILSPPGKMRLNVMLEKEQLDESKELYHQFYQCTGCRGCEQWCPFENLVVPELLRDVRIKALESGLAPRPVYKIQEQLDKTSVLYPPEQLAPLPVLAETNPDVLFFAGCAYRSHNPGAIDAALAVFKAAGVKVMLLEEET